MKVAQPLTQFEQQLSRLQRQGLLAADVLNFFGSRSAGSPFIEAAERLFDLGTGDISFDAAPIVLPSEHGAYVSAWVWVERRGPPFESESHDRRPAVNFSETLEALQAQGLTVQVCIDYIGQQQRDSIFVQDARRFYQHKRGVVVFDADPMVSESAHGAYVNAWLWVWNRDVDLTRGADPLAFPPRRCCRREGSNGFCYTGNCSFYK
ncbi:hypothetical protein PQR70_36730 [Paraburkholderia madseniana]|uniref:hypothetical protein n=1 Tax=Paraburkholderia madseniana TaxID=2599607 RepID=UPI0038B72D39